METIKSKIAKKIRVFWGTAMSACQLKTVRIFHFATFLSLHNAVDVVLGNYLNN